MTDASEDLRAALLMITHKANEANIHRDEDDVLETIIEIARAALAAAPQPAMQAHRSDPMTTTPTPAETLRAGIDLINGDLTGAEWKRACRDFIKQATAALAAAPQPAPEQAELNALRKVNSELIRENARLIAAPQPAPTHECPVCEETVTWTRPGSPYCGECAADNGRDVRMRSIGTAPQPAPEQGMTRAEVGQMLDAKRHDREALVEAINQAQVTWSPDATTSTAHIADALLARGLRLPGGEETMAWAAKIILSQPKRPDSPVAEAFTVACAHLEDRECGAETTNEIIETFLKALAGEDN